MTAVFHARLSGRFIEIQSNFRRKKLHGSNQDPNFLRDSYSNRDNVRTPIQFKRESQFEHLKRWFFLKNTPIYFHVNCTIDKMSCVFPALKSTSHFLPIPQCLVDQIQIQKPILVIATNQMPDHTWSWE